MKQIRVSILLLLVLLIFALGAQTQAQQASPLASTPAAAVPHLVKFGGNVKDLNGKPLTGTTGVTFALYKDDQGGAPLWIEMQNVSLDSSGHYSVMLGATMPDGLPTDLFTSGEARWLGVQPEGQGEQPRILLLSVPYALKAGDAATLGGLPPSAFVQAVSPNGQGGAHATTGVHATASAGAAALPTVQGSGTLNFLPIWTGTTTIGNSTLFEKSGKLGIGTTTPATTLDVKGAATIRGNTTITGALTASSAIKGQTGSFSGASSFGTSILSAVQKGNATAVLGFASGTTGFNIGVGGLSSSTSGVGVSGEGGTGVSGVGFVVGGQFQAGQSSALILSGLNPSGAGVFNVDGSGNLSTAGTLNAGPGASISGNGLAAIIGDPGCGGPGTTAIGFSNAGLSNCSNYAVRGDTSGNLYINSSGTGWMFFDHNNSGGMSLDPSGNLGVQGIIHASGAGNSFGISTDSNASQARAAGGFVKAMAYVDPFAAGGIAVVNCYNSQMTGAAVSTPPCGITLSNHAQGSNVIDFGFQVNDRFIQITAQASDGSFGQKRTRAVGAYLCGGGSFQPCNVPLNATQTHTYTFDATDGTTSNGLDVPFFILVY